MTSRFSLFTRTLRAAGGLFIAAFGIYLTIQANIGLAPWDALNMALAGRFGVSYGTASISMSILVVLADLLLGERIGMGTLLDANAVLRYLLEDNQEQADLAAGVPIVLSTGKCSPCDRIAAC